MPQTTTPGFAADILPRFRPGDISCMRRHRVRLGEFGWMTDPAGDAAYPEHAHAHHVYARLADGTMPPEAPWPAAAVALFKSWMDLGYQP